MNPSTKSSIRIATVLCGSGFKDGSEIREAVATLWALSEAGAQVSIFAPDAPQTDVVNCLTGSSVPHENRNMLVEAARIARGQVSPLSELNEKNFDGLLLPGGFGVAKNLCDWAYKASAGKPRPDIQNVLQAFHRARKPIGAICIAPALVALCFPGAGFEMTLGAAGKVPSELEKLGHRHVAASAEQAVVDLKNRIVTTPAYMIDDAPLHEIFNGIRNCVREVLELTHSNPK